MYYMQSFIIHPWLGSSNCLQITVLIYDNTLNGDLWYWIWRQEVCQTEIASLHFSFSFALEGHKSYPLRLASQSTMFSNRTSEFLTWLKRPRLFYYKRKAWNDAKIFFNTEIISYLKLYCINCFTYKHIVDCFLLFILFARVGSPSYFSSYTIAPIK